MVINRPPYLPSRDLNTEALRIGVPLDTKKALADAARRQGTSVSGIVRDAVREVIERDSAALQNPVPGARR